MDYNVRRHLAVWQIGRDRKRLVALFCLVALLAPKAFNDLGPLQDNLGVAANLIYSAL
jgi:hypothetical protein